MKIFPRTPKPIIGSSGSSVPFLIIRAIVYRRMNDIPSDWGTAVNVQAMVFGNMGEDSGTGVAFTRNPATGENKLYGEYLINAQGEDVVAGIRTPEPIDKLKEVMPEIYHEFAQIAEKLENTTRICRIWNLPLRRVNYICCRPEVAKGPQPLL